MEWKVYRKKEFIGEFGARTKKNAILKAQEQWLFERFGQSGALTTFEISEEEKFLKARFSAKKSK